MPCSVTYNEGTSRTAEPGTPGGSVLQPLGFLLGTRPGSSARDLKRCLKSTYN